MFAVIKLGNAMRHHTMMKLRIATGLGLILFMATMMIIGGPVRVTQAQADEDVITLASLAGKFAGRGSGFFTFCFSAGLQISCSSASPVSLVPYNETQISQQTRDAAGNGCEVFTRTYAPVFGTKSSANVATPHRVFTGTSFDPMTGSGTASF